ANADVYLDTAPYNAGTAANDALFMGVPVVTCTGETMANPAPARQRRARGRSAVAREERWAGRAAGSELRAIGLADLVAADARAYEQRALALALDADERRSVKGRPAQNRRTHPLIDMARFTEALEKAFTNAAG